jgi:hypothetical protein
MLLCVGKLRGINYGTVYGPDGNAVARIRRDSKVAKGTRGQRQPFLTVNILHEGEAVGVSLGTRHPNRRSALNAVRRFLREYPPARIAAIPESSPRSALALAVACFKYDHYTVCASSQRTYTDPRLAR